MKHEKKIVRIQGLIRGFIKRMKLFRKIYKNICSFEYRQGDKHFNVNVYKRDEKLSRKGQGRFDTYKIEVIHKATGQKVRVAFGHLPSGDAKGGME